MSQDADGDTRAPSSEALAPAASSWRLATGASQPLSFPRGGVKKLLFTSFPPLQKQAKHNEGFLCVLPKSFFFLAEIHHNSS